MEDNSMEEHREENKSAKWLCQEKRKKDINTLLEIEEKRRVESEREKGGSAQREVNLS